MRKDSGNSKFGWRCVWCHSENPEPLELVEIKPWVCLSCKRQIVITSLESTSRSKFWKVKNFIVSKKFEKWLRYFLFVILALNLSLIILFLTTGINGNFFMIISNIIYWQSQIWRLSVFNKKTL